MLSVKSAEPAVSPGVRAAKASMARCIALRVATFVPPSKNS